MELGAVNAGRQGKFHGQRPVGAGGELPGERLFARGPALPLGGAGGRRLAGATAGAEQVGGHGRVGHLQLEYRQCARGGNGFAVEGGGAEFQADRPRRLLPLGGVDVGLQGGVAKADHPLAAAGLAGGVGHVHLDPVHERGVVAGGNLLVGPRGKRHAELAGGIGGQRAAGDLLRFADAPARVAVIIEPGRQLGQPDHPVTDGRAVDGGAGVGLGLAGDGDRVAQPEFALGRLELHIELGPLVLLNPAVALPGGLAATSRMAPSSRPVGAVHVPLKEPKSLVTKSALAIS